MFTSDLKLCSFWPRMGAAIFDFFTLSILSGYLSLLILTFDINSKFFINIVEMNQFFRSENIFMQNITYILANCFFMIFIFIFWRFNGGSTVGQKLMRIKVVHKSGKDMSLLQTAVRAIVYTLFYNIPIVHVISTIMILFRKDKVSLHDFFVSSRVVYI